MTNHHAPRRRRQVLMAMVAAGLFATSLASGATSLALFTDQATTTGSFTTGTIMLDAAKIDALSFSSGNMAPGDTTTGTVVVENDGSLQLRYSLATTSVDDSSPNGPPLYSALTVTVKGIDVDTVGCGSFDGASILAATTLGASLVLFGNPAPTIGTGDHTVNAGANETLCIRIALPIGTDDTYQGAVSTTTFTFDAEQTANN